MVRKAKPTEKKPAPTEKKPKPKPKPRPTEKKPKPKPKPRPTRTPELEAAILETIATTRVKTEYACKQAGIGETLWKKWLNSDPDLQTRYARAKYAQLELMADEILEIADDLDEDPQSRRVRIDTRKWLLSKLMPKKYGDRLNLASDGEAPLVMIAVRGMDRGNECDSLVSNRTEPPCIEINAGK